MVMTRGIRLIVVLAMVIWMVGCDKGPTSGQGELRVYMTDAPGTYDAVNIVIREVSVHSSADGWKVINDSIRTFNLLSLTNGASVLLGGAMLDAGHYTQIRLLLDSGSTVVVGGVSYALTVPSGFQTGVKLTHEFTLQADYTYELMLDFDASRSVLQTGTGDFKLKPTIRVHPMATSGAITGYVIPANGLSTITAFAGADTAATVADSLTGMFKLIALPAASYSVHIEPADTLYRDTTLTGVQVSAGQTTSVGTIALSLK